MTKTKSMLDLVSKIAALEGANGNFQRHVAYDLRGLCLEQITMGQMAQIVETASERFNRLYDAREMTEADVSWAAGYNRWAANQ